MRNDLFRAVIGQRQDTAALGHHLLGALRHGDQRIGGNVHRHQEVVEAGVDILPAQLALVGEADRVDDEIDRLPALLQRVEGAVERFHVRHVAFEGEIAAELFGQRADALLQRLALIGEGHLGALLVQLLGNAPGQRLVVGESHDQPTLALHQSAHRSTFLRAS